MNPRIAEVQRNTAETQIFVQLNLDGTGKQKLNSGIAFLDHMLDQIARHGLIDLEVLAKGDLHIDGHHTVEDIGITFGQAFAKAIGDKRGVRRYGNAYVPLDEALSRVVVDLSGRPGLVFNVHIDNLRGDNAHHQCETIFKAFARALRAAVEPDPRLGAVIPSTKGSL
jgi:imidazoleglycerol-phosphate dehydratase